MSSFLYRFGQLQGRLSRNRPLAIIRSASARDFAKEGALKYWELLLPDTPPLDSMPLFFDNAFNG